MSRRAAVGWHLEGLGDGVSTGHTRITTDAARSSHPIFSKYGFAYRNQAGVQSEIRYGPDPSGTNPTFHTMYDRFWIRPRVRPSANQTFWGLWGSVEGSGPALYLAMTAAGALALYNLGNAVFPGTLLSTSAVLTLNQWYRVEVFSQVNNLAFSAPDPPYENNGYVEWQIDGALVAAHDRAGIQPTFGIDRLQDAQRSFLGNANIGVANGLQCDFADWAVDDTEYPGVSSRTSLLRITGIGTYDEWTAAANRDPRALLDMPFPQAGGATAPHIYQSNTANERVSFTVEALSDRLITGALRTLRVSVYFSSAAGTKSLILRRNGVDQFLAVSGVNGAWRSYRVDASSFSVSDTFEIGVRNDSGGVTQIDALGLVVEHDTAEPAHPDGTIRVIPYSYVGTATQVTVDLGALDAAVANQEPDFVWTNPVGNLVPGIWWWRSQLYAKRRDDAARQTPGVLPALGKFYVVGTNTGWNGAGTTYQGVAVFDPKQRIMARGAVASPAGTDNKQITLTDSSFPLEALFCIREANNTTDGTRIFYRGAGMTGDDAIGLGGALAAETDAIQDLATGTFQLGTKCAEQQEDVSWVGFTTQRFTTQKLIAVASYDGDGAAGTRAITVDLSGLTPALALVGGRNATARWLKYPGITARQFTGGSAGDTTAITALGPDTVTVGTGLNASGVRYTVLAFAGGTDAEAPPPPPPVAGCVVPAAVLDGAAGSACVAPASF